MPLLAIFLCGSFAQAQNISSLDTGAGYYVVDTGEPIVDPHWRVSLISTNPSGQTPPAGIPDGRAYLVPNPLFESNVGYPINTSWVPNDATSTWITYSTPTYLGGDEEDEEFQYEMKFLALSSGVVDINYLSDNQDKLYVNGNFIGSNPDVNTFATWLPTPDQITVTAGSVYTVDFDVENTALSFDNPTGARVVFTGDVNAISVPEPGTYSYALITVVSVLFGGFLKRCRRSTE